jgi:hypothetical protein
MKEVDYGPTCRLAPSPEVGPGTTVGTLKQGYPCYKEKTVCRQRSLWLRDKRLTDAQPRPPWGHQVAKGKDVLRMYAAGLDPLRGKHRTLRMTSGPAGQILDPLE